MNMKGPPITVVEIDQFLAAAARLLTETQRADLVVHVACNPESGDVMAETGGVRKLRWAAKGKGKSGGVRVIYYYQNESLPIFMIDIFAKNEKANLSKAERNAMKKRIPILVKLYQGGRKR